MFTSCTERRCPSEREWQCGGDVACGGVDFCGAWHMRVTAARMPPWDDCAQMPAQACRRWWRGLPVLALARAEHHSFPLPGRLAQHPSSVFARSLNPLADSGRFDDECRSAVAENLELRGIHVHSECNPTSIEKEGEGRYVLHYRDGSGQEHTLRCGKVMMATGRRANTRGIGLEVRRVARS